MISDDMAARGNFAGKLRAFANVAPDQKKRSLRLIAIQQIQQLRSDRRVWPVVKCDRQLSRRISTADGRTKKLRARVYAAVSGKSSRRGSSDRRRTNQPGIHGGYCRTGIK